MMSKGKNLNAAGRGGRKYRSFPVLGLAALSLLLLAPGPVSAQSPALGLYGGGGGGGAGQPGTTAGAGGAGGAGGLLTDAPGSGGTVPAGAATSPNGTGGGGGAAGDAASIVDGAAGTASGIDSESAGSSSGNSPDLTYRLNRNVTYIDDIEIIAGSGGDAGFAATGPSGAVGNGGNGGSVSLLGPGRTVTVDGRAAPRTITVQSGGVGADNGGVGGSGGDVAVNLNTLRSNGDVTIDLIRGDTVADGGGQIDFRLNTLSVNGGPTTMTFGSSAGVALEDDDIVRFG
ncbi:MAG: hypothetical protein LBP33_05825, partial [Candidatus Adiutrix sp.]|nr:hypothetical protein [Candidatus Adiutrix sp.]